MNKKGFTLIELLVYIALLSIVSLLLGRQLMLIVNNFASGKQIAKQQAGVRDVISTMTREIRNTGLKVYLDSINPDTYTRTVAAGVVAADQSSFLHKQGTPGDTLTIYKARLNGSGCELIAVDTIKYYLRDTWLARDCKSTGASLTTDTLAGNVYALQFEYGIYASSAPLFDQTPITSPATNWTKTDVSGTAATKTNGADNFTLAFTGSGTGNVKYVTALSDTANRKYLVRLIIDPSNGFPGNLDSLRFAFKTSGGTIYGSEKFRPYSAADTIRLTIPVTTTGAVYAFIEYYAHGAGQLIVKGVDAQCSELGAYSWKYNPTTAADKLNTRAIRIYLLTRSADKAGTKVSTPITVGEVSVGRSGQYTWRLLTETIEIPNNGMF